MAQIATILGNVNAIVDSGTKDYLKIREANIRANLAGAQAAGNIQFGSPAALPPKYSTGEIVIAAAAATLLLVAAIFALRSGA